MLVTSIDFSHKVATETWVFDGKGHIESVIGGWSDVLAYYERISKNVECQTKDNSQKDIKNSEQPSRTGTERACREYDTGKYNDR